MRRHKPMRGSGLSRWQTELSHAPRGQDCACDRRRLRHRQMHCRDLRARGRASSDGRYQPEAAKSAARATGNNAIALRCDVSQKADVDGVVEETLAAFGTLDILVNNAGATNVNKPAVEISEAEYDRIFAVNVKGIFFACQAVIPAFRKRGGAPGCRP